MMKTFFKNRNNKVTDFDITSLKPRYQMGEKSELSIRCTNILAVLIFSMFVISACSDKKLSENIPQTTSQQATAAAALSPAPSSTPLPSATITATTTSATSAATQQITISAASEELSENGFMEYNQYNFDSAIKYFNQAISADQNNYKAYAGKGCSLCFKGDYTTGMPLLQKAIDIKPDYPSGYFYMAMGYKLQKDYDNSLVNFNKAISLNSGDTWSYYGIATIYADRGDITTSLDYLEKAINLDPSVKDVAKEQDHFQPYLNNEAFQKLVG